MDEETAAAAERTAFRYLLQDLETAVRRQNQILTGLLIVLTTSILSAGVVAGYYLSKLDAMQFATQLIS